MKTKPRYYFYDPHPGMAGCLAPLPEPVRLLGARFDGRILTENYVVSAIRRAAGDGFDASLDGNCVMLRYGRTHIWRVLRAKSSKAPKGRTKS